MQTARILDIPGVGNFRQLGGYGTTGGQRVKGGLLYRSASLNKPGRRGARALALLGLETVVDLRSQTEITSAPDQVPPGAEYLHYPGISTIEADIKAMGGANGSLDMKSLILGGKLSPEMMEALRGYLQSAYRQMGRQPAAFAKVLRRLLDKPGRPLLFHCTAGKDRTGVCAAFLLLSLGVPEQTVMEDYLLSNTLRAAEVKRTLAKVRLFTRNGELVELVRGMLTVKPAYLEETLRVVREEYGGFGEYCRAALGLAGGEIAELRRLYLEPA